MNDGTGNKYVVDGVQQDSISLVEGETYVFDWSAASGHPFRFSTNADGTHAGGVEYTSGVVVDAVAGTTTITVAKVHRIYIITVSCILVWEVVRLLM